MSELLNFILNLFKPEKSDTNTKKVSLLIILATILLVINYFFGFSKQYNFEKKVENLKNIEILLKSNIDNKTKKFLLEKRNEITEEYQFDENEIYNKPKKVVNSYLDFRKFRILHYISSSWIFIFILIYIPFSLSRKSTIEKGTYFISRLTTVLVMMSLSYIFSILYANLLEFVPILSYKYLWINYIFNFFSVFILLFLMWLIFSFINFNQEYTNDKKLINNQNIPKSKKGNSKELEKLLGSQNPILWSQEIIKYNWKNKNKTTIWIFNILVFLIFSFLIYCVINTSIMLIEKYI